MSAGAATVRVRAAAREDLSRIWELMLELAEYERMSEAVTGTRETLGKLLFDESDALFARVAEVTEVQTRIAGYAILYTRYSSFRTRRRLWLEDLYVEPAARGTGAGRELMRDLARLAIERGCDRVDWDVLDWNQMAIDFYRRQGAHSMRTEWTQFGMDRAELERLAAGEREPTPRRSPT